MTEDIAARFARETATHEMTILHDDGLYRHLRFEGSSDIGHDWWSLTTWPHKLVVNGSVGTYVFSVVPTKDMFELIRQSSWGGPNFDYWAEKVVAAGESVVGFSSELFEQRVAEYLAKAEPYWPGVTAAWESVVGGFWTNYDTSTEEGARHAMSEFTFRPEGTATADAFVFRGTGDWDLQAHDWRYMWSCHAAVEGIRRYDLHRAIPAPASPYALGSIHGGRDGSNWVVVGTLGDGSPVLCDWTSTDGVKPLRGVELQTLRDVQTWPGLDTEATA